MKKIKWLNNVPLILFSAILFVWIGILANDNAVILEQILENKSNILSIESKIDSASLRMESVEAKVNYLSRKETEETVKWCYDRLLDYIGAECHDFWDWNCEHIYATAHCPKYDFMSEGTRVKHFYARWQCESDLPCEQFCYSTFNWAHENMYPWTTNYPSCMDMCKNYNK